MFEWVRSLFAIWLLMVFGVPLVLGLTIGRGGSALSLTVGVLACLVALASTFNLRALKLGLGFSVLVLNLLALRSILRVAFVLRHGGMDCASCQGSPLLFLWSWIIESLILIPGVVLVGLLLHGLLRQGRER